MSDTLDPATIAARREAMRREMRSVVLVHSGLYLGMIFMPAFALIWARNQADRYLWIGLATFATGLMVVPAPVRWRLVALAVATVVAFALRFTVLR